MNLRFAKIKDTEDDYVKLTSYLGNGYYSVRHPDNTTQEAHESTLDIDRIIHIEFPTWGKA